MRIKDEAFAKRLEDAADAHPHCPPKYAGRQIWVAEELTRRGHAATKEAVSKWFSGDSIPRNEKREILAQIFGVDVAWLMWGTDTVTPKERKLRNAEADGAVNLLAGMIQMDGGYPAFPEEKDKRAAAEFIDLYAVIRGANYSLHVSVGEWDGEKATFAIPAVGENVIVIGILRKGFVFDVFEITPEAMVEYGNNRRSGPIEITVSPTALRRINGFDQRL